MPGAVTIDFHNTLFLCDDWFQLEVHELVTGFLQWYADETGSPIGAEPMREAARRYRALRDEVITGGVELDAVTCIATVLRDLDLAVPEPQIAQGVETLMRPTLTTAQPRPGAVELVAELDAAGVALGVVSSAVYHPFLEWALAQHGLRQAFDVVVTSASAGVYKSRPEIYWHALQALGGIPEQSIHIGDSYRFDVLGAQRAGMRTVWLDLHDHAGPDHQADLVVRDLHGLAAHVLNALPPAAER